MRNYDIMLDIETLGTNPGSVIASIGAVAFNPLGHLMEGYFYECIDIEDAQSHGLTIDASTVKWWLQQSNAARGQIYGAPGAKKADKLSSILKLFSEFVDRHRSFRGDNQRSTRIWAKPTTFDICLMEAAYHAVSLPVPWHYRETRDVRTLVEAAGVVEPIGMEGIPHNALDDAKYQASLVIRAFDALSHSKYYP